MIIVKYGPPLVDPNRPDELDYISLIRTTEQVLKPCQA